MSDEEGQIGDDVLVATINNPIGFTCNCQISNQVYVSNDKIKSVLTHLTQR